MGRKASKLLSVFIVLVMAAFCFTGCIRFRTSMSIRGSGKADLAVIYAFYKELIDEDLQDDLDDLADSFEDDGWTVEDYKKGDYRGYIFTMNNVKVKDFEEIFNSDAFEELELGEFELTRKGSEYTIEWETNAVDDVADEGITGSDLSAYGGFMEVVIELPMPAKEENATDVSKDGKTLTWNLLEEDEVKVTFTLINIGLIVAIVAIVFVMLCAAAVVVILLVLKKKKAGNKDSADVSDAPVAPAGQVSSPEPEHPIDFSAPLTVEPVVTAEAVVPAPEASAVPETPVAPVEDTWNCPSCGKTGITSRFCSDCGMERPLK